MKHLTVKTNTDGSVDEVEVKKAINVIDYIDELPEATKDSPDFVHIFNGFIYKKYCSKSGSSLTYKYVALQNYAEEIVIGKTISSLESGRTYIQCKLSGNISASGNYYFVNCTGSVAITSTAAKVYITDSPDLSVGNIISSNWRNVFIDGVASYKARTSSILLPYGYNEGYVDVASNVQVGDTVEICFRYYQYAQKVYTFRVNEASFKFGEFIPLGSISDNDTGVGNYAFCAHVNYENNTLKAGMEYYGMFSEKLSTSGNLSCAWVTLSRRMSD